MNQINPTPVQSKGVVRPRHPNPRHNSQVDVTRALGVDICAHRYREGNVIPREAALIAKFAISRTVLRESIKTLSAKGLLGSRAHVGTWVRERCDWNMFDPDVLAWTLESGIDQRFLRDLADIRLAVEPCTAALAAARRPDTAIAGLRETIAELHAHPSESREFANADLRLHLDIATLSGNPFMRSMGAVIEAALRASFRLSAPTEPCERNAMISAHEAIVDAIAIRDTATAEAAMTHVIHNGLRRHGAAG